MTRSNPQVDIPEVPRHPHPPGCGCTDGVAYLRVSKVGNREKVISPRLQMQAIVPWSARHSVRIVAVVTDIDKSGRTFRKRSVDKMIEAIRAGRFGRVVLWKWSRWARGMHESTKYVKRVQDAGGRVDSATEDFDIDTAIGRFQWGVTMAMDEYHSDSIKETWQEVFRDRREQGLPHAGRKRFGYSYTGPAMRRRYVVKPEEADAVRVAYDAYLSGTSYERIAASFNEQGFRTTQGNRWTAQAATRMMDTGFAAGLIRERSRPTDAPANSIGAYDVWRDGAHESIISTDVWQRYLSRRAVQSAVPPRARRAVHALSALVFCSECGRRMQTKYTGKARTHQWQCTWQRTHHPDVSVTVSNRLLLGHVRGEVNELVAGRENMINEVAEREYERRRAEEANGDARGRLKLEVDRWTRKLSRLFDMRTDGEIGDQDYHEKRSEYERQRASVQAELDKVSPPVVAPALPDFRALESVQAVWDRLDASVLRDGLATLFSRIVVSPRTAVSSNASVADRVRCVGVWEDSSHSA